MPHDETAGSATPTAPPRRRPPGVRIALTLTVIALLAGSLVGWLLSRSPDSSPGPDTPSEAAATTAGSPSPGGKTVDAKPPHPSRSSGAGTDGPLAGKVIVIDPGHNPGNFQHTAEINRLVDAGTHRKECDTTGTATNAGYTEAAFTRDVSVRLRALLERRGAKVSFTHDGERPFGPCVDERARFGNNARADAVISVHADGSARGNRGFHMILPGLVTAGTADTRRIVGPSRELGEHIAAGFARSTGSEPSNYVGEGTGLHVRKDLGGLNLSTVPKVFIECGNMRDPEDADLLTNPRWRQRAAHGMAAGLQSFLVK
ncbi:N-acetylmuramoyl-L-alanine amidase [Streptomyces albipurpureus]|uniref:N-acetylmuramoyl-L-alanine amidase n=1 Tax=Streptomyces albipurpureus TaxID=2897419 RepID=A0ABT0UL40_9ACTN|nr:N-acetylmuramoyl-L-alanine amidase [Streptomyces sp. CWNU-1]MCM2388734.1 N-acetylmuramoyl-L-alanine amidase [Streptomyces sp. CWNU-1]